jgi:hypothetical protein
MVGSYTKEDSDASSTWASTSDELSIRDGKVNKKRGLSRFYPSKAQSFDCIAELLCPLGDSDAVAESALMLSKTMCRRGSSRALQRMASQLSGGSSHLRRVNTTSFMTDDSSGREAKEWQCLEEDLCHAMEATSIQSTPAAESPGQACIP